MGAYRVERDSMGELKVPAEALYGAQTQRAVRNFPISGLVMPREVIRALGLKKPAGQLRAPLRTPTSGTSRNRWPRPSARRQ